MDQARLTTDNVVAMSAGDVNYAWPVVEPLIKAALARTHGEYSAGFIHMCLQTSAMQMWAVFEGSLVLAVAITEICQHQHYRLLRVVLLAGKGMARWVELEAVLEAFAREQGCAYIEGWTRRGMARRMRRRGYREVYTVIRKQVSGQVH